MGLGGYDDFGWSDLNRPTDLVSNRFGRVAKASRARQQQTFFGRRTKCTLSGGLPKSLLEGVARFDRAHCCLSVRCCPCGCDCGVGACIGRDSHPNGWRRLTRRLLGRAQERNFWLSPFCAQQRREEPSYHSVGCVRDQIENFARSLFKAIAVKSSTIARGFEEPRHRSGDLMHIVRSIGRSNPGRTLPFRGSTHDTSKLVVALASTGIIVD